jgi:carboxyl-terminal processing protease
VGSFDARTAWQQFDALVKRSYAYFERPGVDGPAVLAHFRPKAEAAADDAAFIALLKTLAYNFADPHFVVGPRDATDFSVVPTSADLHARWDGDGHATISDVRHGSDAQAQGVRGGMRVLRIDGATPTQAIGRVAGRGLGDLSPQQAGFALNVALAGRRRASRELVVATPSGELSIALRATVEQAMAIEAAAPLSVERYGEIGVIRIANSLGNDMLIGEFEAAIAALSALPALLVDLRNTPSGGNTTVARGILGHFVREDRPYQMHVVPYEQRAYGPRRKFVEYVSPYGTPYPGRVFAAGGRWTGSMGEGLMLGFEAIGATTVGSELGDLLGALSNLRIAASAARIDFGTEQLFDVRGRPREDFRPSLFIEAAERTDRGDPVLDAVRRALSSPASRRITVRSPARDVQGRGTPRRR